MIKLHLGRKTLACLIFENVFRDEGTPIACAYGVNVETIEMNTSFGTDITLQTLEAKKLLNYFKKLSPKVNVGLRTQINSKVNDIITQLIKQGEPIT
tara:strand:+ start:290 stop:580 length:291 start_codon:yes stop_codon:yes gene_type:complete